MHEDMGGLKAELQERQQTHRGAVARLSESHRLEVAEMRKQVLELQAQLHAGGLSARRSGAQARVGLGVSPSPNPNATLTLAVTVTVTLT